ncbi:uncharacterized protein LOC121397307 [Xenopus laevis]|uniref:Uncharacterized protein LOC121397307 n=1 Tax=Xenopus laevis TaxID=8355 RepID=A0A8J1LKQ6_XENLA|nr:uncharacterized protein LOC121397307 [Xenopus laevis]
MASWREIRSTEEQSDDAACEKAAGVYFKQRGIGGRTCGGVESHTATFFRRRAAPRSRGHNKQRRGGRKHKQSKRSGQTSTPGEQSAAEQAIINLSGHQLTPPEVSVLIKGLSYVPSVVPQDFNIIVDNYRFSRTLRLQEHFKGARRSITEDDRIIPQFRAKSVFDPIINNASLRTFSRMLDAAVPDFLQQSRNRGNCTKEERTALRGLRENSNIIVKPADKGGAVVVLDYEYYRTEILGQLSDASCYCKLSYDPTLKFQTQLKILLEEACTHGWISETLYNGLYVEHPQWPIVQTDTELTGINRKRIRFGHRRHRNIKELLSPADPVSKYKSLMVTGKVGVYRCGGCVMCSSLITGDKFFHPHTGKPYEIKQRLTCISQNVIYIIKCPCGLLYCGKTRRQLRERISMHRATIRAALDPKPRKDTKQDISKQPVAQHWLMAKHPASAFKCMPIDCIADLPREATLIKLCYREKHSGHIN